MEKGGITIFVSDVGSQDTLFIYETYTLRKKVPTTTFFVPYMEPVLLNSQKRFLKIQEPFGEPVNVL